MRIPSQGGRDRMRFNMTPMIDVVFLLIIFFLVSSHLAKQEVQAEIDLPAASTGREPDAIETPRVTINVVSRGDEYVLMLGAERLEQDELIRRVRNESDRIGLAMEVRIRADYRVPYHVVEPVMIACAKNGIWNITFAVVQAEKPSS